MIKLLLKMLIGLIVLLLVITAGIWIFVQTAPQFGGKPGAARLAVISRSPHYRDGRFQNLVETNMDISFGEMIAMIPDWLFNGESRKPKEPLPTRFEDEGIEADSLAFITWFGHSAVLLEMEGKKILLDPMLGPAAAPVSFMTRRFPYEEPLNIDQLGHIDAVIISHDHYDHLDYPSITALKDQVGHFYTALGVGAHLRRWGVADDKITELDWWDSASLGHIRLVATPARHFSGRGLADRNKTQWASWVVKGTRANIYFSGDSGYGPHFKEIGKQYGPFDFAMIECGQYNEKWKAIHMMPEESVQAAIDVKCKTMMPIHWGAFKLSLHSWTEPIERAHKEAERRGVDMVSPVIGDRFAFSNEKPVEEWWTQVQ